MKTYTLQVTITEGSDEFWESLEGRSGADEVLSVIRECLAHQGFLPPDCLVQLTEFSDEGN